LLALGARLNMLSPKKAPPMETPYNPPIRFLFSHISTECAKPVFQSSVYNWMIWSLIHVPASLGRGASAQARITCSNSMLKVTV